jgi:hypothetical protein
MTDGVVNMSEQKEPCMDCGGPNDDPVSRRCDKCKETAADRFWAIWSAPVPSGG